MIRKAKDAIDEAVKKLASFQKGEIHPIDTGYSHLNDKLMGGLRPGDVVGIVGRSGHGKTHTLEEIEETIIQQDVIFLKCQWEIEVLKSLVRKLSRALEIDPKEVFTKVPEGEALEKFREVCTAERNPNIYYQPEPVTPSIFGKEVLSIIDQHPHERIVVAIDNLENVVVEGGSQKATMDVLLYQINILKKRHPFICFIVLNQLNKEYLQRIHDPRQHEPLPSDIYGTEALFKLCDVVFIKMIPYKLGIRDKYMVIPKNAYKHLDEFKVETSPAAKTTSFDPYGCAFYHYLKDRNYGDLVNDNNIFIERFAEKPADFEDNDDWDDDEF